MILEVLVRIEVPPFTALIYDMNVSVAVFVAPSVPAVSGVIEARVKFESRQVPEAAGLGH